MERDERGWPVRMVDGVRVCARPAPGHYTSEAEFRVDGYCSCECRELHEAECERDVATQFLRQVEQERDAALAEVAKLKESDARWSVFAEECGRDRIILEEQRDEARQLLAELEAEEAMNDRLGDEIAEAVARVKELEARLAVPLPESVAVVVRDMRSAAEQGRAYTDPREAADLIESLARRVAELEAQESPDAQ